MRQFIASKENDKIKLFKKIASSKKYRSEYGLFPLEGVRLVEDAAMENAEMSFVIASETTLESSPNCLKGLKKNAEKLSSFPMILLLRLHKRRERREFSQPAKCRKAYPPMSF